MSSKHTAVNAIVANASTAASVSPARIRNVKRYTATILDSKFGKKRLDAGNPFAVAFSTALGRPA